MKNWSHKLSEAIMILVIFILSLSVAHAQGSGAELGLNPSQSSVNNGDEFSVAIELKNPSKQAVISARTWLQYNPNLIEAIAIETNDSPFTLVAPGEDDINKNEGRIQIGRSNISGGVTDADVTVATVRFRVLAKQKGKATIEFFDYQANELGHTSINIIDQGFPVNILSEAPMGIDVLLNQNVTSSSGGQNGGNNTPVIDPTAGQNNSGIGGGNILVNLKVPSNLRIGTGPGYIDLIWDAETDTNRVGFNVYYGKQSGLYTRRRTLGNANQFRLDNLPDGETYYVAVTAYNQTNQESDYSNEAGIIVGQPLSSTHPYQAFLNQYLNQIPNQPQNGPLVGWLALSAAGMGGAITFRKKK